MRFMMMVKHVPEMSGPPPQPLIDAMNQLTEKATRENSIVVSGGLAPVAVSTSVRLNKGKLTTTDGPYSESKEIVGGFAVMNFKTREDAIKGAQEFMELHRLHWPGWEGVTEVRQIFAPEDLQPCNK